MDGWNTDIQQWTDHPWSEHSNWLTDSWLVTLVGFARKSKKLRSLFFEIVVKLFHNLRVRLWGRICLVAMQHVGQQFHVVVRHVQLLQTLRNFLRPLRVLHVFTHTQLPPTISTLIYRRNFCPWKITIYCTPETTTLSGGSINFENGARQCISPVFTYRKCTQRTICRLYGKTRLIEINLAPIRGPPLPPPASLNPPLANSVSFGRPTHGTTPPCGRATQRKNCKSWDDTDAVVLKRCSTCLTTFLMSRFAAMRSSGFLLRRRRDNNCKIDNETGDESICGLWIITTLHFINTISFQICRWIGSH